QPDNLRKAGTSAIEQLREYTEVSSLAADERFAIMSINEIRNRGAALGIDFKDCVNEAQFLNKLKGVVTSRKQVAENNPEGGFYSAEDADSYPSEGAKHKLEGAFCVWEMSEIKEILGDKNSEIFCRHYGVKSNGNVDPSKDIQGELKHKNVLIERYTLEETAEHFSITLDQLKEVLSESRKKLSKYRCEKRPKPHRDDKILAAWNDKQNQLFYDEKSGGYYNVKEDTRDILLRLKDEPSANSVSVSNLILLSNIVNNPDYNVKAERTLKYFAGRLNMMPFSMSAMVANLMLHIKGVKQIMVIGREQNQIVQRFIEVIRDQFIPNKTLLLARPENELLLEKNEMVKAIVQTEFADTSNKGAEDNVPSVHICENFTCGALSELKVK
ncbi:6346_t:CDS:2, partial [Racocetra fulgida]